MKNWSQKYLNWTGDFQALVETANAVLVSLDPPTEGISASLVRHYQSKDLVGRGQKSGRQAFFNIDDLRAVVETKIMAVNGWGLDKVAEIYQCSTLTESENLSSQAPTMTSSAMRTPAMDVISSLMKKTTQMPQDVSFGATASLNLSGKAFPEINGVLKNHEPQLMSASQALPSQALKRTLSSSFAYGSSSLDLKNIQLAAQSTSVMRQELRPAPWFTAYIDPRQLSQTSEESIEKACDDFKKWCQSQRLISSSS